MRETQPLNESQPSIDRQVWTDQQVEQNVGNLLRAGVLCSAFMVFTGAIVYLISHGHEQTHYAKFRGEPGELRSVALIFQNAFEGNGTGIIQLGLLLLIATPVARVLLAAYAFLRQRDYLYVTVSLIVLAILMASLLGLSP